MASQAGSLSRTVAREARLLSGGSTTVPPRPPRRIGELAVYAAVDSLFSSKLVEKCLGDGRPEERVDAFAELIHLPTDRGEVEVLGL